MDGHYFKQAAPEFSSACDVGNNDSCSYGGLTGKRDWVLGALPLSMP